VLIPDGNEVVVEDNEGQEVQEEVGALAVNVPVGVLQYLVANSRQQGHAEQNDELKIVVKNHQHNCKNY
jgi:hypothetical protein